MAIFRRAAANYRTWMLAATYGACFGVEIFIHNIAASYYVDRFGLSLTSAGLAAGIFGGLALFARALGGSCHSPVAALAIVSDGAIHFRAQILSEDGREAMQADTHFAVGETDRAEELAREMLARAPDAIRRLFDPK